MGTDASKSQRTYAPSPFIQFLEFRRLLAGTPVPSETLGVEGHGEYTVNRPSIELASDFQPHYDGPAGASLPGFQIEVVFTGGLTASQQAVFTTAANRWQSIITGDIPDVGIDNTRWGAAVDDIRINASGVAIDGVNGILGQAGPDYIRVPSFLPISGTMEFDTADLAILESSGQLNNVIIHEMGHVLGLGVLWDSSLKNVISGAGGGNPAYTGGRGKLEYNALARSSGINVPVENSGGSGTRDSHWRESTFDSELMTGWLNNGTNPLSRITAGQFIDLGYPGVNVDAADLYTIPGISTLPGISGFTDSPDPVTIGNTLTLSLSSATDSDGVANVKFYREANGIAGLQAELGDTLLNTDSVAPYSAGINTTGMAAGTYTYYVRATDVFGALSTTLSLTNAVTTVSLPAAPSMPDLLTDSGFDTADNITNDNAPIFTGTAEAESTVTIFANGSPVGSGPATGGVYSIATSALASNTYNITAAATNAAGTGAASGALAVTIDTIAPTASPATFTFQTGGTTFTIPFSENVNLPNLTTTDFSIQDLTTLSFLDPGNLTISYDAGTNVATVGIAGEIISNGDYQINVIQADVNDVAGNLAGGTLSSGPFFFQQGDANRDRAVNTLDFNIFAANFGSLADWTQGNFNFADGVDSLDFSVFLGEYGKKLLPSPAPLPSSSLVFAADNPNDGGLFAAMPPISPEDGWQDLV